MPNLGVAKADIKPKIRKIFLFASVPFIIVFILLVIGLILTPRDFQDNLNNSSDLTSKSEPADINDQSNLQATSITLANNRVEMDEALVAYASAYSKDAGLKVEVETISGSADYNETLKVQLKAGNFPDIFVIEGPAGYALWQDRIADLSSEKWVSDTEFNFINPEGQVAGFPIAIEGYGLAYNADLLALAGIDPATLNNFSGTKAAFEKLDKMKKDLGITSVVAMTVSSKNGMAWVSGLHNFNIYLSGGLSYGNPTALGEVLKGQVEVNRLAQYAEYVNLLFKYADPQLLLSGSYNDQAQAFAKGLAVFIQDASWLDPTLANLGANFDMAYAPLAAYEPVTDGIFAAPTSWYCVDRQSQGLESAKGFLTALVTTEAGQRYMVEAAGLVPAFKSVKIVPTRPLSKSLKSWSDAGKVYSMMQDQLPAGFGIETLGPIYEQLAAGTINTKQFTAQLTAAIESLGSGQSPTSPTSSVG